MAGLALQVAGRHSPGRCHLGHRLHAAAHHLQRQENWVERVLYLATPFGFAVAAVVVAWVSGSTWAAVGVHGGHHMASLVLLAMRTDEGHPVAWVLEGALWLVVAGVVWFLTRRRALITSR